MAREQNVSIVSGSKKGQAYVALYGLLDVKPVLRVQIPDVLKCFRTLSIPLIYEK